MNNTEFFLYLLVMAGTTYLVRMLPFVLVKEKLKNRFLKSFFTYIPYAVLAAMTVPGAFLVTGSVISAVMGIVVAILISLKKDNLLLVAVSACITVYVTSLFW